MKVTGIFESLALALMCAALVLAGHKLGAFEEMELHTLDVRIRQLSKPETASKDVVVAAIDESSLRAFRKNGIIWKWPRDFYGALVDYLHAGGAKSVVFDVVFPDPDIDRVDSDREETDGAFAAAMQDAGNVLLAATFQDEEDLTHGNNPLDSSVQFPTLLAPPNSEIGRRSAAVLPIPLFQQNAAGLGAAAYEPDIDGVYRRLEPFVEFKGKVFPHLAMTAYMQANNLDRVRYTEEQTLRLDELEVPLDEHGRFLLYWYGRGGPEGVFKYYPIYQLIGSAIAEKSGKKPEVPSTTFKGKTVIVGTNAAGLFDMRTTPFTAYEPYPGLEIYATMISNLAGEHFMVRANDTWLFLAVALFSMLICMSFLVFHSIRLALIIALLCAGGWLAITALVYHSGLVWLDLVTPEISVFFSFATASVVSYWREGKARKQLRTMFGRYLSPVVVAEIVEKSDEIELGGKEVLGTVFFSDVKGFTELSESMPAPELVLMLNEYFSLGTEALLRHDALVDNYIGDAIMAIFGAPLPSDRHQEQACMAAVEMNRSLSKLFNGQNSDYPHLVTRIGIHTGHMVVGNIGSTLRADYTAIGDTVNLAARLEGVNKVYGTEILVSEMTLSGTGDLFLARELDRVRVKGKTEPVKVFELMEDKEHASKDQLALVEAYDEALKWYREGDFNQALDHFQKALVLKPEDGPTLSYLKRCKSFASAPPQTDWDGVVKLDTK